MGVRDEYQFSRIGPVIALLLIEALRDPFARRKIDCAGDVMDPRNQYRHE